MVLSGVCSLASVGVSEAEADDDCEDTDSLLPINVSSVLILELSPTADTYKRDAADIITTSKYPL